MVNRFRCGRPAIALAAIAGALLSPIDGRAHAQTYNWKGRVDSLGGTPVVRNQDTPLLQAGELGVELLWRGPTADEMRAKGAWSNPISIRFTGEGIFVADRTLATMYKLSPSGSWTHSIRKPNNVAGDMSNMGAFAILQGELLVPNNNRIEVFSSQDGSYIRSQRLPIVTFGIDSYDSGSILLRTVSGYQRLRADGRLAPFSFFGDSLDPSGVRMVDPRHCAVNSTSNWRQRVVDCYRPIFSVRSETAMERVVMIDRDSVRVAAADAEQCLRRELGGSNVNRANLSRDAQMFYDRAVVGCNVRRDIRALVVDEVSGVTLLYLQNPNVQSDGKATINVFSKEGVFLASHTFDESWSAVAIYNSQIAALVRSSTGAISVASYRIAIPAAAIEFAARVVK